MAEPHNSEVQDEWENMDESGKASIGAGDESESDRAEPDPESGPVLNSMEISFEDAELELNVSEKKSADKNKHKKSKMQQSEDARRACWI